MLFASRRFDLDYFSTIFFFFLVTICFGSIFNAPQALAIYVLCGCIFIREKFHEGRCLPHPNICSTDCNLWFDLGNFIFRKVCRFKLVGVHGYWPLSVNFLLNLSRLSNAIASRSKWIPLHVICVTPPSDKRPYLGRDVMTTNTITFMALIVQHVPVYYIIYHTFTKYNACISWNQTLTYHMLDLQKTSVCYQKMVSLEAEWRSLNKNKCK